MEDRLTNVLNHIGENYKDSILTDSRYYIEVNIGEQAKELGYMDLYETFKDAYAVIPLQEPSAGMKVRVDGRTFVDYCVHLSGFAVPGYVIKDTGIPCQKYTARDSMILCT